MYQNNIGIVIVSYNVRHFLTQCLQSIYGSSLEGINLEVWVVDNASVDGSSSYIETYFPRVHLIKNTENKGFAVANNQAIRKMSSEFVLLLNPDTILQEDTLQKSYQYMIKHPHTGALGVRMIDGAGRFLPESKRQIPNLWNSFCKLFFLSDIFPKSKLFSGYNLGYLPEDEINEVEVLCGAFMFLRSSVLEKTGLLDESFFMYGEDIDLSHRILDAGYKVIYFPKTSIVHFKGESTKKSSVNYIKTFYGAMSVYVDKHFNSGTAKKFSRFIHIAIGLRAALAAFSKSFSYISRQLLDFLMIVAGLSLIKSIWAIWYFNDPGYYDHAPVRLLFFCIGGIWVYFLWFFGHYDKRSAIQNTINGILWGSLVILSIYALLPETLRASRAIIVFGLFWTFILVSISKKIHSLLSTNSQLAMEKGNLAIVAYKENALKLEALVRYSLPDLENIYFVTPDQKFDKGFFNNSLENLKPMIHSLRINDVVFSSEDVSFKEIIHTMSHSGSNVRYRIGGDDSLSIIGSDDKNSQGKLYSFDLPYKVGTEQNLRYKRVADVIVAVILLLFSPFLFIIAGLKLSIFSNLINVIIGKMTLVGYGGTNEDFNFLPILKQAVIKFPYTNKIIPYTPEYFKSENKAYATNYNVWNDLGIILKNLDKLGSNRNDLSFATQ